MATPAFLDAVPSNRKVWTFTQPDNTKFQAVLVGDEFYAYHKTIDGDIIVQSPATGYWHYAAPRGDGSLELTPQIVGKGSVTRAVVSRDTTAWLKAVERIVDEKVARLEDERSRGARTLPTGSMRGVVLLANFSDTTATFSQADFNNLLNTQNYASNGASGSVRDYFLEASYGSFTLQTDVHGWFNLTGTRLSYGGNTGLPGTDVNPQGMVTDAILASNSTVDYSVYDSDSDGFVDLFGVVHQGQGEEQTGAPSDCIWSHEGQSHLCCRRGRQDHQGLSHGPGAALHGPVHHRGDLSRDRAHVPSARPVRH